MAKKHDLNRNPRTFEEVKMLIESQGGVISIRKNGHLVAVAPNGRKMFFSRTPSDYRAIPRMWRDWKNTVNPEG